MESEGWKRSEEQGSSGPAGIIAGGDVTIHGGANITYKNSGKKVPTPIYIFPPCSDFFSGREEELRQVEDAIVECEMHKTSLRRVVAIIGYGGMGKSEIAKVIATRLQLKYKYIFWFDAQTRTSLDSSFKHLAHFLKIPFNYVHDLANIYHCLAENYGNGIFIFDNAEVLKDKEGNFGLEEYLVSDVQCQKPLFLVTSRNPWGTARNRIKCIPLDRLSDKDSRQCLLKLLAVENYSLPESLEEAVMSLVGMIEGHPMGLSLLGSTLADKADDISLDTIESRVNSYIKLLKEQSLDELSRQSKYEARLQIIFDSALKRIEETCEGKVATELLNIIALLSPDNIHAGLVDGIYCRKRFEKNRVLWPRFFWDSLETTVGSGLNILRKNSLVKIETRTYQDSYGVQRGYDMIKVHRLIQKSAQNRLLSDNKSGETIEKIARFTEHTELPRDHMHFLVNFCLQNRLGTCYLQNLSIYLNRYHPSDREIFQKVMESFRPSRTRELKTDYDKTLSLLELLFEVSDEDRTEEQWSRAKRWMFELSPDFAKQYWVILLCIKVTEFFDGLTDGDGVELHTWLTQVYNDCEHSIPLSRYPGILSIAKVGNRNCDLRKEGELISKIFAGVSETERWTFWLEMHAVLNGCTSTAGQLKQLIPDLLNTSGTNFFSSSLKFSQDSYKHYCLINWASWFCLCVLGVVTSPELRTSLLASEGFVDSLWDITNFGLRHFASVCNIIDKHYQKDSSEGLIYFIGTWCTLFLHDVTLYERFGSKLDSEVENWLQQVDQSSSSSEWSSHPLPQVPGRQMREFLGAEHCSDQTRHWIQELLGQS